MSAWVVLVGLIFIIEGLIWLVAPRWLVGVLQSASPAELRAYGALVVALGVAFLWAMQ